jgi:hypothetical protein
MNTYVRRVVAIPGLVCLTLGLNPAAASLSAAGRPTQIHLTKDCSRYTGLAGSFCTITSSSVPEIRGGSRVVYGQALGIPTGMLDSNVVLDAGNGDRAVGRCTLDFASASGLCTFSDGTGRLAGFHARVEVSSLGGAQWAWDGTHRFSRKSVLQR